MGVRNKLGNKVFRLAYLVLLVVALTSLIPDIIDKSLLVLGMGDGKEHHEMLGHIGIGLTITGVGLMVTLVCRYAFLRILRRGK